MVARLQIGCISSSRVKSGSPVYDYWIYLLDSGDMPRNVFHCYGIFHSKPMALTFYTSTINENTTVCSKTYRVVVSICRRNANISNGPAKAKQMWSSNMATFRTVRGSCNWRTDFFSTPRTTTSCPRTPTWLYVLDQSKLRYKCIDTYCTCPLSYCFKSILDLSR